MSRPRQVSDEEILGVARACFLEAGPGVSTTVIARRLGVSQAALFKRFGTKEELMVAALAPPARPPFVDIVDGLPDGRDVREQLVEIALVLTRFFESLTPCLSVLRARGIVGPELLARYEVPPPVLGHRAVAGFFRRASAEGRVAVADAEQLAMAFVGAIQVRSFLTHVVGRQIMVADAESYANTVVELFWRGIAPPEGA